MTVVVTVAVTVVAHHHHRQRWLMATPTAMVGLFILLTMINMCSQSRESYEIQPAVRTAEEAD